MRSDKIVVQKYEGGFIYKPEINTNELKIWVDEVEKGLDSCSEALIDASRLMAKCVNALTLQKSHIDKLETEVKELREILRGMLETQAQMQITKADRSELK